MAVRDSEHLRESFQSAEPVEAFATPGGPGASEAERTGVLLVALDLGVVHVTFSLVPNDWGTRNPIL